MWSRGEDRQGSEVENFRWMDMQETECGVMVKREIIWGDSGQVSEGKVLINSRHVP